MGLMTKWTIPDAPSPEAIVRAALEMAAEMSYGRHVTYMMTKGRNPEDYLSEWSQMADKFRTLASNPAEVAAIIKKAGEKDNG